jgi:hypothetical protein
MQVYNLKGDVSPIGNADTDEDTMLENGQMDSANPLLETPEVVLTKWDAQCMCVKWWRYSTCTYKHTCTHTARERERDTRRCIMDTFECACIHVYMHMHRHKHIHTHMHAQMCGEAWDDYGCAGGKERKQRVLRFGLSESYQVFMYVCIYVYAQPHTCIMYVHNHIHAYA